ncbi:MAG: SpoIIE family protein phosphatase [Bacteroidales bacterium]|nr:SpoIIE family protein phosphatase [Bacteroidales bacterium]
MKNFLSGILFCVLALTGFAQDEYVDSLRRELAKTDDDWKKIEIYEYFIQYYSQIDNNIADEYADTFLLYSEKLKYPELQAYAYYCKGNVKYLMGDYATSVKYYDYAEKIADGMGYVSLSWRINLGLGEVYREYKNYKLAHYYFNEALENMKTLGDDESYAAVLVNIADLYYKEKKYDTTLMLYDSALNITSIPSTKIAIYNNIAELQYFYGDKEIAKGYYLKMMLMLDENTDSYTLASALNNISSICIREGKYDNAFDYLAKVDSICNLNSFGNIRLNLYLNYHNLYVKTGNYEQADYYLQLFNELNDNIYSIEITKQLTQLEIEQRNDEIAHQKILNIILISVISIVIFFIAIIAFLLVKKSRMNKMLAKLNSDLKQRDEEISSNLDYAREIQLGCMSSGLTDCNLRMFVLDLPKITVGGDFHIAVSRGEVSYVVVGDCTGHGISGGFLSVLGIKSVYAAIEKYDNLPEMASFINNEFCKIVSSAENLKGESLCLSMLRICGNEVRFLGSKQKMWLVSDGEIHEYKSSNAIMGSAGDEVFIEDVLSVKSGDVVFLSSDGYPDQFGAVGKLKYPRFRNILLESSHKNPDEAKAFLSLKLDEWRGSNEQTDDVMVVGIYF